MIQTPKQLQTDNVYTYDVEDPNRTNKGKTDYSLEFCGLFPEEQEECRKETRRTDDLLYID